METNLEKQYAPIGERLLKITLHYNLSLSAFARSVGVTPTAISKTTKADRGLSLFVIQNIVNRYPDISLCWLILGEGFMLRSENKVNCTACAEKDKVIDRQNRTIEQLNQSLEFSNQASRRAFELAELYKLKCESK